MYSYAFKKVQYNVNHKKVHPQDALIGLRVYCVLLVLIVSMMDAYVPTSLNLQLTSLSPSLITDAQQPCLLSFIHCD